MTSRPVLRFSFVEPGIGLLAWKVRSDLFAPSFWRGLGEHLDRLEAESDAVGLILALGDPDGSPAGACVVEAAGEEEVSRERFLERRCGRLRVLRRLSQVSFPTVAAIDGLCAGIEAEAALWCDRRVVSDSPRTALWLPHVRLGRIPSCGGCVRAARLLSRDDAIRWIAGGEAVDGPTAAALGLADRVAAAPDLLDAARDAARRERARSAFLRDRRRRAGSVSMVSAPGERLLAGWPASDAGDPARRFPLASRAAADALLEGAGVDEEAACRVEGERAAERWGSAEQAALTRVFLLSRRIQPDFGVELAIDPSEEAAPVGIIGAGAMGAEIAAAHLRCGQPVVVLDADPAALARGVRGAIEEAARDAWTGLIEPERAEHCRRALRVARGDSELASCRLILETVVENRDVKRGILARLERRIAAETILATNTSTLPIGDLAQPLERPERFCGLHFCMPVRHRPLVEVVRGPRTADATVEAAAAWVRRMGKLPIVVRDGPGFLVNRLLLPYMSESLHLLSDGATMDQVEQAAEAFGMLLGPFAMYDMVGLDTALLAGRTLWEAFPERIEPSPILPALVKRGRLGRKRGVGFYRYPTAGGRGEPDPELPRILEAYVRRRRRLTPDQITARLFLPMLLEATRAIGDGVVGRREEIDLGVIHGLGFPAHRGGLLGWADQLGADRILDMLKPLEALGRRAAPTEWLREAAKRGGKLRLSDGPCPPRPARH